MLKLFVPLSQRFLPVDRPATRTDRNGFDHVGTLLLALTLAAYALAMTTGHGSFGLLNVALLVTAVVGVGLFALAEAKAASSLIQLVLFRNITAGYALFQAANNTTVMTQSRRISGA